MGPVYFKCIQKMCNSLTEDFLPKIPYFVHYQDKISKDLTGKTNRTVKYFELLYSVKIF